MASALLLLGSIVNLPIRLDGLCVVVCIQGCCVWRPGFRVRAGCEPNHLHCCMLMARLLVALTLGCPIWT